jgi:type II secretory pathway component PulF
MGIISSLEITASAVGFPELEAAILRVKVNVTKGLTLGEAFQRETFFPKVVVNIISVSEKAGHIDDILMTLSDFYESEIDASIKTMLSLVEPILLLFMGGLVAMIALSIIVPIYQLIGTV